MPVTITVGPPGTQVGPGVLTTLQTDFLGTIPPDTFWDLQASDEPEFGVGHQVFAMQLHGTFITAVNVFLQTRFAGWTNAQGSVTPQLGQTIYLKATAQSPTAGEIDTSSPTSFTWTNDAIGRQIQVETEQTGGTGLTLEEHGWLDQVQQFVQNTLTFGGTIATQLGAGGLIDHPDLNLLSLCDQELTLVGTGSITRPRPGVGVEAYGLRLNVAQSPPGAGLLDGVIREFSVRVIQLVTVHKSASQPDVYPVEIFDSRAEAESWLWRAPFPDSISYHVTPGFVVLARWLCLPQF